ncbi:MAG TPA: PAS domain-containing protein [Anaerolineae bacterium]
MTDLPSLLQNVQTILDHLGVGTLFVSARGVILYASQHSGAWLGCESERLAGQSIYAFIKLDHRAIFRSHLHATADGARRVSQIHWKCGDEYQDVVVSMCDLTKTPIQSIMLNYWRKDFPPFYNGGADE